MISVFGRDEFYDEFSRGAFSDGSNDRVHIGEVDGGSTFGMKIFDGTGTADSDILVEFSETTNNIAGWVIGT